MHLAYISVLIFFCGNSNAMTIDCSYEQRPHRYTDMKTVIFDALYGCFKAVMSRECDLSDKIHAVSNNHMPGKTNVDVENLSFISKGSEKKLPKNIGAFFPNLLVLRADFYGELTEISNEVLKSLPKLRILYVNRNKITALDGDLFKYSPNLQHFAFDHNKITNMGDNLFKGLSKLTNIWPDHNPCVKKYVHSLSETIKLLRRDCKSSPEMKQREEMRAREAETEVTTYEPAEQNIFQSDNRHEFPDYCFSKYDEFKNMFN